jgi:hypothetical protein
MCRLLLALIHSTDTMRISIVNLEEMDMETIDHFEQAKQIAGAAVILDSKKNEFPDEARAIAVMCVDNLHTLAEKLAGNQASKIYS